MPTTNPRVNVTLEPADYDRLKEQAKRHHLNVGTFTKTLILDILDEIDQKGRS